MRPAPNPNSRPRSTVPPSPRRRLVGISLCAVLSLCLIGCRSYPPIRTEASVDLSRFMGDWYVLAHVPASLEKNAYNAVESYELEEDGTISTTYRFREGALDGPEQVHRPRGFVRDEASNAVWGMQFIWPFKMEYRILLVGEDYTRTVVGRTKRDYAWIMARTPTIPEAEYEALVAFLAEEGYDLEKLRRVPHGTPEASDTDSGASSAPSP